MKNEVTGIEDTRNAYNILKRKILKGTELLEELGADWRIIS
jgi:hypothetical protein